MVLMENDVIFTYMNERDKNHGVARGIFEEIRAGELSVDLSSVGLIEMELIYRSQGREERLLHDLAALMALPSVRYIPLTPEVVVTSAYLRRRFDLSFFDSHYAAAALGLDGKILSFDEAYDRIPGLVRIDPRTL